MSDFTINLGSLNQISTTPTLPFAAFENENLGWTTFTSRILQHFQQEDVFNQLKIQTQARSIPYRKKQSKRLQTTSVQTKPKNGSNKIRRKSCHCSECAGIRLSTKQLSSQVVVPIANQTKFLQDKRQLTQIASRNSMKRTLKLKDSSRDLSQKMQTQVQPGKEQTPLMIKQDTFEQTDLDDAQTVRQKALNSPRNLKIKFSILHNATAGMQRRSHILQKLVTPRSNKSETNLKQILKFSNITDKDGPKSFRSSIIQKKCESQQTKYRTTPSQEIPKYHFGLIYKLSSSRKLQPYKKAII